MLIPDSEESHKGRMYGFDGALLLSQASYNVNVDAMQGFTDDRVNRSRCPSIASNPSCRCSGFRF